MRMKERKCSFRGEALGRVRGLDPKKGTRESQITAPNVHTTSQTTQVPKLINKNKEDENTTTVELLSVHVFSNHRAPIKISTVQNEEQDELNVQLKFHNDPTVNE
ncbi:hypothetical protein PIB30_034308 [Stylosanthes scabra]|uniref:Uncharacterized protein n=1 Tax=Stylosanthes scabra TaxID=79078 RepID=A0ABU6RCW9_9FABA|nr:hypothetical protein [Stylosanthes scabra]